MMRSRIITTITNQLRFGLFVFGDSLGHDGPHKLFGLKNDKAPAVGLPSHDMRQTVGGNLRNQAVQDNGKGRRDAALATPNGILGGIVQFVGIVVIIVHNEMAFVLVDGFAGFKVTWRLLWWCLCLLIHHGGVLCLLVVLYCMFVCLFVFTMGEKDAFVIVRK